MRVEEEKTPAARYCGNTRRAAHLVCLLAFSSSRRLLPVAFVVCPSARRLHWEGVPWAREAGTDAPPSPHARLKRWHAGGLDRVDHLFDCALREQAPMETVALYNRTVLDTYKVPRPPPLPCRRCRCRCPTAAAAQLPLLPNCRCRRSRSGCCRCRCRCCSTAAATTCTCRDLRHTIWHTRSRKAPLGTSMLILGFGVGRFVRCRWPARCTPRWTRGSRQWWTRCGRTRCGTAPSPSLSATMAARWTTARTLLCAAA